MLALTLILSAGSIDRFSDFWARLFLDTHLFDEATYGKFSDNDCRLPIRVVINNMKSAGYFYYPACRSANKTDRTTHTEGS